MPDTTLLIVLVVRQAAARSTLAARLGMGGATVWTAQHFDEQRPQSARAPAVLITDEESIERHAGGLEGLLADPQWRNVVVLRQPPLPSNSKRLLYIDPADPAATLARLLPEWEREG